MAEATEAEVTQTALKKKVAAQREAGITYLTAGEIPANCNEQLLIAVRNFDSTQLVMVFVGMGGKVGLTLDEFYKQLPNPKPNVLFVSTSGSRKSAIPPFVRGILTMADDLSGTIAAFEKIISEWGITQVSTVGASIGTYGAVMYGVGLQARKALAFGPVTAYKPGFDDRVDLYASKKGIDLSELSPDEQDLALYCAKNNQGTEVRLFYSAEHANDRLQAENFNNVPSVTLVPIGGSTRHSVMRSVAANGQLKKELALLF